MVGCRLDDSRGDPAIAELVASPGSGEELYRVLGAGLTVVLGAVETASCCAQSPPVQSNPRRKEVETVCHREIVVMFPYTLVASELDLDSKSSNCSMYSYRCSYRWTRGRLGCTGL